MGNRSGENRANNEPQYQLSEADTTTLRNALAQIEGINSWMNNTFKPAYARVIDAVKNHVPDEELTKIKIELVKIVNDSTLLNPIFSIKDENINEKFEKFCKTRSINLRALQLMKDVKTRHYLNYPSFEIADWINEINNCRFAINDFLKLPK